MWFHLFNHSLKTLKTKKNGQKIRKNERTRAKTTLALNQKPKQVTLFLIPSLMNTLMKQQTTHTVQRPLLRWFAANVYDLILLFSVAVVSGIPLAAWCPECVAQRAWMQMWFLGWGAVYTLLCWTRRGQTLGALAWRMRVVSFETQEPPTWTQALLRYFWAWCSLLLGGMGHVWVFFDPEGRSLYGRLSGTQWIAHVPPRHTP